MSNNENLNSSTNDEKTKRFFYQQKSIAIAQEQGFVMDKKGKNMYIWRNNCN